MSTLKPWIFIVNKYAGSGKVKNKIPEIINYLNEKKFTYKLIETESAKQSTELTKTLIKNGNKRIVAVGGDGTIYNVINGIMQCPNHRAVLFAVLPVGGGNDFVKSVPIPKDWKRGIDILRKRNVKTIDVGKYPDGYFINSLGFGFDAMVAKNANKVKNINGITRYMIGILKSLLTFKYYNIAVRTDYDLFREKSLMLSIGNGKFCGGGFKLTPDAQVSDGKLDVCFVKKTNIINLFSLIPAVIKGNHTKEKFVKMYKTKILEIYSENKIPYYADGEIPEKLWEGIFRVQIIRDGINLLIDKDMAVK